MKWEFDIVALKERHETHNICLKALPIVPRSEPSETKETINIRPEILIRFRVIDKALRTYKVLVTGVPVNIHRYTALMYVRLRLVRVALSSVSNIRQANFLKSHTDCE